MKIVVIVAMRQEDDSAKTQAVEFDSIKNAGAFIADVFNQWPDDVACAVEVDGQSVDWRREGEKLFIGAPIEDDEVSDDDRFECESCGRMFDGSPNYAIEWEQARTVFFDEDRLPEVDIQYAETYASFCTPECRDHARPKVYELLGITATYPGIGPVEQCSRCGSKIDMTQWHTCIVEAVRDMDSMATSDMEYLAVLCPACKLKSQRT